MRAWTFFLPAGLIEAASASADACGNRSDDSYCSRRDSCGRDVGDSPVRWYWSGGEGGDRGICGSSAGPWVQEVAAGQPHELRLFQRAVDALRDHQGPEVEGHLRAD